MADRQVRLGNEPVSVRDARNVHASLFLSAAGRRVCAAIFTLAASVWGHVLPAQVSRPWLDWQTTSTEHFVFHYPSEYRVWALALAGRMEAIRGQVQRVVGFVPTERVHIIVDDPINASNGEAYTPLDAPTIVIWPTPPNPRDEIGNYVEWGELVATHEFAHVAHLTRRSRNRLLNVLESLSPVPLGPVALNAPRWVLEGYATYVEGKVTGSGRPNHAWRAALLRQFALEGRLPGYGSVSSTGPWETSSFAYMAGSAYFEWLARREGDSSVTALWRRMTAKTNRSFDEAFTGVYGAGPAQLYGRFVADLTADALAFDRALARDASVPGTLVQRLIRNTGDPAVSPDGRFVALAVRHPDAPSQLVVWRTADEPDTLSARRREQQLKRDPEDVPDRSFFPAPKRVIISLIASDGYPYESPRWMPDNRHLVLVRNMPMSDGTIRPDLFIWSAEDGTIARLTSGAGLRDADPGPDGRWAAATRCDRGWCDLVRVDLTNGSIRVLRPGSLTRNYYRPRVSRRTGEIVVAEQAGDRWRIARVTPETGALRYADPEDGVTRYDASFAADGQTVVATSEAGGIANIERLDPTDAHATRLTAVTGAAVAADVAPDGMIWFLSLTASGYDLRRIHPDSGSMARAQFASAPLHLLLVDSLSAVLPPRIAASIDSTRRPAVTPVGEEEPYGYGPSRYRYVPLATTGDAGSTFFLSVLRTDPIGRLGISLIAGAGDPAPPEGASIQIVSRSGRNTIVGGAWGIHEGASDRYTGALHEGLDITRYGGDLRLQHFGASDGGEYVGSIGILSERQSATTLVPTIRTAAISTLSIVRRQRDEDNRYFEQLSALGEIGSTESSIYYRQRATLLFGLASGADALTTVRASYGTVGGGDGSLRERYVIGGLGSPLMDPTLDARRVDMPAYPVGSTSTLAFSAYRVSLPYPPFEVFYAGASPDLGKTSLRAYGVEIRERIAGVAALGTPDIDAMAGLARAVDAPVAGDWRLYLSIALRP